MNEIANTQKKDLLPIQNNKLHFSMPNQQEMDQLINFCKVMASAPFYQKLGHGGVMAIYLTAKEFNVPFMASLNGGMHTFDGKVTFSAQLINAMIINAGHKADILQLDEQKCIIHFKRGDRHNSDYKGFIYEYTIEQAAKAGYMTKANWKNNPKDMLFSRCLTGGGRKHIPEVFVGVLVSGELMGDNVDGNIVPIVPIDVSTYQATYPPVETIEPPKQTEQPKNESSEKSISPDPLLTSKLYGEFISRHSLLRNSDGSESRKLEFIRKSGEKSGMTEREVVNFCMKNEEDFINKFNKWEEVTYI